jgi:hypothetical protein
MTQPKDQGKPLHFIAEALAESVAEASDEALTADALVAGRDFKADHRHVQGLLQKTLLALKQAKLKRASQDYGKAVETFRAKKISMPKDAASRRVQLEHMIAQQPTAQSTLQFRDYKSLSDQDVETLLRTLGALDEED